VTAPEHDLLAIVAAAPGDPEGVRRVCTSVQDWDALADCAAAHGLAGVVLAEARGAKATLPKSPSRRLEGWLAESRAREASHRQALGEALGALHSAGIRAVALKGLVLGERLYGGRALRPTTDIDLLVSDGSCERATAALVDAGWSWKVDPTERYHRRHHQHLHLLREGAPLVELHFRALTGFGTVVPAEGFLARALPYRSEAGPTFVLAAEDEVLYLAVHAAGHLLVRLGWLYDLKLLIRASPNLAWEVVRRRAEELGVWRAVTFALGAARSLGAEVSHGLLLGPGFRDVSAERVRRLALRKPQPSPGYTAGWIAFHALLADTPRGAARHLAHHLGRVARRRVRHHLARLAPEEWSG